jgi:hypothetical protein
MAVAPRTEAGAKAFYFGTAAIAFVFWLALFLGALAIAFFVGLFSFFLGQTDYTFFSYSLAAFAFAILSLQVLRTSPVMTRFFHLKDDGGTTACPNSLLLPLACFIWTAACSISLVRMCLQSEFSEGFWILAGVVLLLACACFGSLKQYQRRLILLPEGVLVDYRCTGTTPWSTIKMAIVLPFARLPYLNIVRNNGASTITIPANSFAVVPESVSDAINKRLEHLHQSGDASD